MRASVIGVSVLLLLIGYFSRLPPKAKKTTLPMKKANPRELAFFISCQLFCQHFAGTTGYCKGLPVRSCMNSSAMKLTTAAAIT